MRPLIYISGPFTSMFHDHQKANIEAAAKAGQSIRYFATPLVPHVAVLPIEGCDDQSVWNCAMRECLDYLKRCDAVLLLPTWAESKGARIERDMAHEWRIPVFESVPALAAWARERKVAA